MSVLGNARHERFAQSIARGRTAEQAYQDAGYKPSRPHASRLATNGNIQARVTELLQRGAERAEVSVEMVLRELAKIGFADIRKVVQWQGAEIADERDGEDGEGGDPVVVIRAANFVKLIGSEEIDDATAAAVSEISQTKDGALRVKLHDKQSALVNIGRHLGMFKERVELTGKDGGPIQTEDLNARDVLASRIAGLASRTEEEGGPRKPH